MCDCVMQGLKMYELVLFNNIFVQLFSISFGSCSFVFPSRWLSVTLDIQTSLEATSEAYSEPCHTSKIA